ncbi:uncharacterized protein FTJAE_5725 [Fusarium tjaetaba]|uniref:Uncharacterized protein n=1 Tax=Fusarium tjaetaba TaxID=1567544 RepID=A0A8H5VWU0_9HYPO|nr:uncharacterized protein FTJAE_5725 [Fusarium tjaetaba]KAF5637310.1 hypothetical protein FTJAE_5725 [Fusarium tjaetaba]
MRKPSVQQPWKAHVPTVLEIEGPVAVGLIDVEVVEDALEVVELLVVEVLELVVVVEMARDVVLVDELVVEDVDEGAMEVEREVVVADVTLETPAGPPATRELSDETTEGLEDTVADEERLTIEDAADDDIPLRDSALGAPNKFEGSVFDDTALESDELKIDEVVLVVIVEARELVEENVAKVVHVVELVLEDVDEDIVADEVAVVEVEVVAREAELALLVLAAEEALVVTLVEVELPAEDAGTELEAEEEALLRPPAMFPKTLSEVLKELVELADILPETPVEIELLTEPVLVEAPLEVVLDPPLEEELTLAEANDDEREALETPDVAPMLVDAIEPELETERAAFEEAVTEELTPLADDKAPIDVGNELL